MRQVRTENEAVRNGVVTDALLPMNELLRDAQKKRYAVPGFNVFNMESLQAVVEVAVEERAPASSWRNSGITTQVSITSMA